MGLEVGVVHGQFEAGRDSARDADGLAEHIKASLIRSGARERSFCDALTELVYRTLRQRAINGLVADILEVNIWQPPKPTAAKNCEHRSGRSRVRLPDRPLRRTGRCSAGEDRRAPLCIRIDCLWGRECLLQQTLMRERCWGCLNTWTLR